MGQLVQLKQPSKADGSDGVCAGFARRPDWWPMAKLVRRAVEIATRTAVRDSLNSARALKLSIEGMKCLRQAPDALEWSHVRTRLESLCEERPPLSLIDCEPAEAED